MLGLSAGDSHSLAIGGEGIPEGRCRFFVTVTLAAPMLSKSVSGRLAGRAVACWRIA